MRAPDPQELHSLRVGSRELSKQERTRFALIEAYLALCSEQGASQVTFEKIAQASGFSFGTVRYHFAGENVDITQSAIHYVLDKGRRFIQAQMGMFKDLATERGEPYDPVLAYVKGNFTWLTHFPAHAKFLLYFYYLCSTQASHQSENQRFLAVSRSRIQDLILEGRGRGLYPIAGSLELLATEVHSMTMGYCLAALLEGTEAGRARQLDLATRSLSQVLKAAPESTQ